VWFYEIWGFLFRDHLHKNGPTLEEFWGEPQDREDYALRRSCKVNKPFYPVWQELVNEEHEVIYLC
jgi:anaerobic magnesium-protoporphyrin IX monomethyl ester cyclase